MELVNTERKFARLAAAEGRKGGPQICAASECDNVPLCASEGENVLLEVCVLSSWTEEGGKEVGGGDRWGVLLCV